MCADCSIPLALLSPGPVRTASQAPACNCGTEQAPSAHAWVVLGGPRSSAPRQQMIARRNDSLRQETFLYRVSGQDGSPVCTALQNKVGTKHTQNISASLVQAVLCQVLYLEPACRRAAKRSATDSRETEHSMDVIIPLGVLLSISGPEQE